MNIRFSGFGGQGIVLSGVILGWAAIFDGKNVIQTQSYGSEARGGSCKCDVIIQDTEIYELEPHELDVLLAFSQPAYDKNQKFLKPGGLLFIDKDLVIPGNNLTNNKYAISASDLAFKKMKHKIMANIIMLGHWTVKTGQINPASMEKSISMCVPPKLVDENMEAFRIGLNLD
jgi:2-oxoglutarate ferredoxin oxidoreductase subunit gamma